ncbi:FomB family phosphonate monophosphate kinase [Streptomonospora sp. PA3]|uniref:FomB family phosphonate monophosphate kinase n=1 Tax=Streptomonospora sp. PA3 TaxID=2607326 RepID=UPI0012DF1030|nr:FomB family phosphonate monophosphate kinase [Streptomonospora sp. PA3]MUL43180.1 FomB family phosphonate monophosphate kinase [Streptomonospora sp. PA3]
MQSADYECPETQVRISAIIDLNVVRVRIATNLEEFPAFNYFADVLPDEGAFDYEVICMDVDRDKFDLEKAADRVDRTFRAKRFAAGYYLVHYFGDPALLITRGRTFYVYGTALERTVWPYFIKHILTMHAADNGYLHLKAGAFVQPGGGASLVVGRNGGGKTVLLTQACLHGADFLTNTHALVRDGYAYGIPSSLRIRRDASFGDLIDRYDLPPHMESGDYLASPHLLFGRNAPAAAPIRNLVLVDYNPERAQGIEEISADVAEAFLDQFSLAVTMYGLKDDLFAHYDYDVHRFAAALRDTKDKARRLTRSVRCLRANVDMLDGSVRESVLRTLAGGE